MLFKSYLRYSRLSVTWGVLKANQAQNAKIIKMFLSTTRVSEEMVTI